MSVCWLCLGCAVFFTAVALKWTILMFDEGHHSDMQPWETDGTSVDLLNSSWEVCWLLVVGQTFHIHAFLPLLCPHRYFGRFVFSFSYAVIAFGCASCPKITCGREGCGTEFCYHCKQLWHPNQTCDTARQQRAQTFRLRSFRSSSLSYSQESGAAGNLQIKHLLTHRYIDSIPFRGKHSIDCR